MRWRQLRRVAVASCGPVARNPALPHRLVVVPPLRAESATRTRTFELGEDEINGHHMDMSHIDQTVTLGVTEILERH
jgi:hypothetical protein